MAQVWFLRTRRDDNETNLCSPQTRKNDTRNPAFLWSLPAPSRLLFSKHSTGSLSEKNEKVVGPERERGFRKD